MLCLWWSRLSAGVHSGSGSTVCCRNLASTLNKVNTLIWCRLRMPFTSCQTLSLWGILLAWWNRHWVWLTVPVGKCPCLRYTDICLFLILCHVLLYDICPDVWTMACYLHTTYIVLSNILLVVFMCHLFSCQSYVFMSYLYSCLSWLRAFDTAFSGAICSVWKERACTIPFANSIASHCKVIAYHCTKTKAMSSMKVAAAALSAPHLWSLKSCGRRGRGV